MNLPEHGLLQEAKRLFRDLVTKENTLANLRTVRR